MKNRSPVLWAFRQLRHRFPALLLLILSNIINAFLIVIFAVGFSTVIDSATTGEMDLFLRSCLKQLGIIAGILLTLTINRHLHDKLMAVLDRDWKKSLLHGLLHGDYAAVSSYHSGELINRLNNDVRVLNTSILNTIPNLASMFTKLIAAIAVLITMEPFFSLIVLAAGVVVVILTALIRRRLKGLHKQVSSEDGKVSGFLQEALEKLLMVQAMDVSTEIESRADSMMESRYRLQRKRKNVSLLANTCVSIMVYGANFFALVWCSVKLLQGTMSFGTLTAIIQLVGQLQTPFVNLSGIIPQYIAMTAAAERLMELEEICGTPVLSRKDEKALYEKMCAICGEDLSFSYDREPIFDDTSFIIPKGEFGVIIGQSGIGKSTLLKLILGIFHPESGKLFVKTDSDAVVLDRSTRGLFAYVPQGNLLISGTLRDNLIITRPSATDKEIAQALHISAMNEYLPSLPQGLDTVIGESAAGLSEGQAQRLSIARAILSQAPILLLDEATSALDSETEELVLNRLKESGKTCIAVTHRPAAIAMSNWTMEIKNGKCIISRS